MRRSAAQLAVLVVVLTLISALAALAAEDLVSFNWQNVQAKNVNGSWKVVDGDHWILDFANNQANAEKAVKIIKFYKLTAHGFVARPDAPMEYYLADGKAPAGAMSGEDAIAFNPATIAAKQVNGSWKIVDGNNWLIDFGKNGQANAQDGLQIIHQYGFTHICFVGRPFQPGKGMMYFRADAMRPVKPQPALTEDCIPFDPAKCEVKEIQRHWKVVEGTHWILDFGTRQDAANQALKVIQFYKMNSICFVGRPDAGMMYFKVSGQAPSGAMDGEDAIAFDPATLGLKAQGTGWLVVDGTNQMMMFRTKADAQKAIQVIQHYGFTQQCFVGRPYHQNDGMMYFRK